MSFTAFLRLVDPDNPAILIHDIILWSVVILLLVFSVVLLIRKYK